MKKFDIPLTILAISMFLWFGSIIGRMITEDKYPIHVYDTDTVSHCESTPRYSKTITREFKPGDTLTSKENGAWILWDSTMIRELQVAFVTDSGTIEILK